MEKQKPLEREDFLTENNGEDRDASVAEKHSCRYEELSDILIHFIAEQARVLSQLNLTKGKNLTNVDIGYLNLIWKNPGITAGELARLMGVHKSSSSRCVSGLAARNLVQIQPDERDNRCRRISITEQGILALGSVLRAWIAFVKKTFVRLSSDEVNDLTALLRKAELPGWDQYSFADSVSLLSKTEKDSCGDQ